MSTHNQSYANIKKMYQITDMHTKIITAVYICDVCQGVMCDFDIHNGLVTISSRSHVPTLIFDEDIRPTAPTSIIPEERCPFYKEVRG